MFILQALVMLIVPLQLAHGGHHGNPGDLETRNRGLGALTDMQSNTGEGFGSVAVPFELNSHCRAFSSGILPVVFLHTDPPRGLRIKTPPLFSQLRTLASNGGA